MSGLVSVIIPAHNSERTLGRAMASVLSQTHSDLELIVIDDGSTDGTLELVRSYTTDERLRMITRPEASGGPAVPRNVAMRTARGEWIAFLDHDDEWLPTKLEVQLGSVGEDTALVYARTLIDRRGEDRVDYHALFKMQTHKGLCGRELIRLNFVPTLTTMVHRTWVERVGGFDPRLNGVDDHDYWLRVALSGGSFAFVDETVAVHHRHSSNLSSRIDPHRLKVQMFSKLAGEFPEYRDELRSQVWPSRHRHIRQQASRVKHRLLRR
jgi:glycosyltransferase involved in cell wall biosynthesis